VTELTDNVVRLAQQGDEAACRALIEALHRPVIATIHRFLGPRYRSEVEDIAQDVFLKVFRALPQFDSARARFTTWVWTFVRNHCYDVLKKRRIPTASLTVAEGEAPRDPVDLRELRPHQDSENQELGRQIEQALAELGEDQRLAFILREYEGLDYAAIASVTGVGEGTVKSRLARARESLRARLQPWLQPES
jgi:RNA polymerase sigma-70 factor (ECF subfamily)